MLVVDDAESVRIAVRATLEALGHRVLEARDGEQALVLFDAHRGAIDVVLLDMTMPGMGGGEVFAALRERDSDIGVLLTSGYDESGALGDLIRLGGVRFLHKPFATDELVEGLAALAVRRDPRASGEGAAT